MYFTRTLDILDRADFEQALEIALISIIQVKLLARAYPSFQSNGHGLVTVVLATTALSLAL